MKIPFFYQPILIGVRNPVLAITDLFSFENNL